MCYKLQFCELVLLLVALYPTLVQPSERNSMRKNVQINVRDSENGELINIKQSKRKSVNHKCKLSNVHHTIDTKLLHRIERVFK